VAFSGPHAPKGGVPLDFPYSFAHYNRAAGPGKDPWEGAYVRDIINDAKKYFSKYPPERNSDGAIYYQHRFGEEGKGHWYYPRGKGWVSFAMDAPPGHREKTLPEALRVLGDDAVFVGSVVEAWKPKGGYFDYNLTPMLMRPEGWGSFYDRIKRMYPHLPIADLGHSDNKAEVSILSVPWRYGWFDGIKVHSHDLKGIGFPTPPMTKDEDEQEHIGFVLGSASRSERIDYPEGSFLYTEGGEGRRRLVQGPEVSLVDTSKPAWRMKKFLQTYFPNLPLSTVVEIPESFTQEQLAIMEAYGKLKVGGNRYVQGGPWLILPKKWAEAYIRRLNEVALAQMECCFAYQAYLLEMNKAEKAEASRSVPRTYLVYVPNKKVYKNKEVQAVAIEWDQEKYGREYPAKVVSDILGVPVWHEEIGGPFTSLEDIFFIPDWVGDKGPERDDPIFYFDKVEQYPGKSVAEVEKIAAADQGLTSPRSGVARIAIKEVVYTSTAKPNSRRGFRPTRGF
jgi:hypothetical protein